MSHENSPILITGAARSGTSMIAGSIYLCGAFKGKTGQGNIYNKKGMFENLRLREEIIKPFLSGMGADKLGQYPLPETNKIKMPVDISLKIKTIMRDEGWNGRDPWMWKCAKMSLVWPVWAFAFPRSKWVIVRREDKDIVQSCIKTGFMNKLQRQEVQRHIGAKSDQEGWQWWVDRHKEKFAQIISAGVNVQTVWPEKLIEGDYSQLKDTVEWLGLEWDGSAVADFIEPKLWKTRRK